MSASAIFISHASKDDAFVKELRLALESHGLPVWTDSRKLRGGNKLAREISAAIENARQVIVVLSPNTVNSPWVRKEISKALKVEQQKKDTGYRVIPLLLPGIEPAALTLWFDEEPVGIRIELKTGALSEALPQLLAALGERLPDDPTPNITVAEKPVAELILQFNDARIADLDGKQRAQATAQLIYQPALAADSSARTVESKRFTLTAPLGPIEADDLRWYLEKYYLWPTAFFADRAQTIEASLPQWGEALFRAATATESAREALDAWRNAAATTERRFSVFVDSETIEGADEATKAAANEAATLLLALPWELLHDGRGYLFHGKQPVRVRRRLPNRHQQPTRLSALPIRILLVSPRPEEDGVGYIDHRVSARPLVAAIESLGELAELTVLTPPHFAALETALQRAADAGQPFDVVHFDGHGVYDRRVGLGGLCFEDPNDESKLTERAMQLIHAEKLAEVMRDHRIPLVFLEACQSAQSEHDPTASVAARLLEEGVSSIVAMSHSVLVETARRFVTAFYQELAAGARVGTAMLAGQRALHQDSWRGQIPGAGELRLQDWFVPVLFQEAQDVRLIDRLPPESVKQLQARQRQLQLGELPAPPTHSFVGRSRDLLKLERMLCGPIEDSTLSSVLTQAYAVVRGRGGEGKTTLTVELARWLVRTRRFERAAFVSLEEYTDARGVLDALGRQLLPAGASWSVAQFRDLKEARQHVERALSDRRTIIVVDNVESVFVVPPSGGRVSSDGMPPEGGTTNTCVEIFQLCQDLLAASSQTRLVFTSREVLPAPFHHPRRVAELRELDHNDAIELVMQVLKEAGAEARHDAQGNVPQHVTELVETVGGHARALTLLARQAQDGVRATTSNIRALLEEQERQHPGDRENSLYASVALSLRRLPPELQAQYKALGVFHSGGRLEVLAHVMEVDVETARNLAIALIDVGLAEDMGYGHLRLDPALPHYLLRELNEAEEEAARTRWAEAMQALTGFLYQQRSQNAELSARLTLLELPNLMALLAWLPERATPEVVIDLADRIESLLADLGRPQALAQATHAREQAAQRLSAGAAAGAWSQAHFQTQSANIDRLLERGQLPVALQTAQQLLTRALSSGEQGYPGASYNIAYAHWQFGRVLKKGGAAEAALPPLAEARRRFEALADAGNTSAAKMASAAITETADCLMDLGRLDEAAAAYQEAIGRKEKLDDQRGVAVNKGQLGTVRMLQQRYGEALDAYQAARASFESLGEPGGVATAWHQIGVTHRQAGQFEDSEEAYRQSLALEVRQQNRAGEAASLNELGNLYGAMERLEDAVKCYRQAAEITVQLQDQRKEGIRRSNLANTLIKLQRYDEARRELLRAIECKQPYGHAAELWKTWDILCELEQATGQPQAAAVARQRARQSYLAYRRDGGESYEIGAQACAATAQAIAEGQRDALAQQLTEMLATEDHPRAKALLPHLLAILGGARDPVLADDPALYYQDAVELQLLLERLG